MTCRVLVVQTVLDVVDDQIVSFHRVSSMTAGTTGVSAFLQRQPLMGSDEDRVRFPIEDDGHDLVMQLHLYLQRSQFSMLGNTAMLGTHLTRFVDNGFLMYDMGSLRFIDNFLQREQPTPPYCRGDARRVARGVRYFPSVGCFADAYCKEELHGMCDQRQPDIATEDGQWFCRITAEGMMPAQYGECADPTDASTQP